MVFRSRRLEDLLGGCLDKIGYDDIVALIGRQEAVEAEDLDYKQQRYGNDPKSREELAKDVAALANHIGGVLVIGMAESRGVPSRAFDVGLDDRHVRDLQQRIAASTAPSVRWEPLLKENPANPGHGFLLLTVPRSPEAPHAIIVPPTKPTSAALRYPRRAGSKTDWLTETYVASAYRQRFSSAADRAKRMRDIETRLVTSELSRTRTHLLVTLVPDVPGEMRINQRSFTHHKEQLLAAQPLIATDTRLFRHVSVGSHRLVLEQRSDRADSDLAHLYDDGSGIWAQPLQTSVDNDEDPADRVRSLAGDVLAHRLMSALIFLAGHARDRCGVAGTVAVEVDLVDGMYAHPYAPPLPTPFPGQAARRESYPLAVDQVPPFPSGTHCATAAQAEVTALVDDLADGGTGLVQAASLLADQVFHTFGIPEAHCLTAAGRIRAAAWESTRRTGISAWADQQSIVVTN
ncbi:AlbA family DNA-binding domain-containing protein [Streptomyces chartreusis]|uniref:AlbA family DNA-binding domain-containing protein n=1 Tax=Streptomyces chartreusis TaxID=1969 RepID=UPI003625899B